MGRTQVLWLVKGLGPGGMERLLVNHAKFGDRDRFEYTAAYLVDRPHSVVSELDELGVDCVRLGSGSGNDVSWLRELDRLVRDRGVEVVHAHSPMPAALARPVLRGRRNGPKVVYTEHNTWDCYGRVTRVANMATYGLDHAQFAVSADAASSAPRLLGRRVEVLVHGIDLEAARRAAADREDVRRRMGLDPATIVIVTVANLRREKGYEVLLDTATKITGSRDDVVFLALGHGPLEQELHERHRALGLGDNFRFLGFRSDALDVMAAADVFTLSSHQEGLPVALMESAAVGLPAVVTSVGGLPDAVEHEVSGLLVPPASSEGLASALARVIDDRPLRERLGRGAAQSSGRFDARHAVSRQESVYSRLVSG